MEMKEFVISRFCVRSDSGKEYTIIEYGQGYKTIRTGGGAPPTKIPKLSILRTSDGLLVNQINPETFKIVSTNEVVRKS